MQVRDTLGCIIRKFLIIHPSVSRTCMVLNTDHMPDVTVFW